MSGTTYDRPPPTRFLGRLARAGTRFTIYIVWASRLIDVIAGFGNVGALREWLGNWEISEGGQPDAHVIWKSGIILTLESLTKTRRQEGGKFMTTSYHLGRGTRPIQSL